MDDQIKPRISFQRSMYLPQEFDNPVLAEIVLMETAFTSLCYGFGAVGKLKVFMSGDSNKLVKHDTLLDDAISLSWGTLTIHIPHWDTCTRLICSCKVH